MSSDDLQVVSKTKQVFQGRGYWRSGRYFSRPASKVERRAGKPSRIYLHVVVWESKVGPTLDGHVHHKDEKPSNNTIDNLELLTPKEHARVHLTDRRRSAMSANMVMTAMPAARAWHASPIGREWHRSHAIDSYAKREFRTLECVECGVEFQTKDARATTRFCHPNCKAKAGRRRRRESKALKQ